MHNALILTALLSTSIFSSAVNANKPLTALSLLNLPIGEQRDVTLSEVEQLWGSQANCETIRTGVGLTRRAYFLETCSVSNERGNTLYDETPTIATYRFLENQLVQVSYKFDHIAKPEKFRRCAKQDAQKLDTRTRNTRDYRLQGVTITEDFQVSVSDIDLVSQVHALSNKP